jgi:hypothetical protein
MAGKSREIEYFTSKTAMMKQSTLMIFFLFLTVLATKLHGQSLSNTNWKTFIGDPLNDSIILHIKLDSSFVTMSNGAVVVRSVLKVSGDTLSLDDYDGQYACPSMVGKYKFSRIEGLLSFILVDDPCDGRAQSLANAKWRKVGDK